MVLSSKLMLLIFRSHNIRLLSLLILLLLRYLPLSSQDSLRSDADINRINVLKEDVEKRTTIAHRILPAVAGSVQSYEDSLERSKSSITKCISNLWEGNIAMALFYVHDALSYSPKGDLRTTAIANSYYGLIQVKLGNHTKAVTALNRCDSLFIELGDLNLIAFHNNNLGIFYRRFKSNDLAENYFQSSLSISRVLNDDQAIAMSLNELSMGISDIDTKLSYLDEAVSINRRLKNEYQIANNYLNLARIFCKSGEYSKAASYLDSSSVISSRINSGELLLNIFDLKSEVYASQGRFKEAYESARQMNNIKKEILDKQNTGDIEQMIQNRIISKQSYELNIHKKESNIRRLYLSLTISISLLVITSLLFLYFYYIINSRRKLQNLESRQILIEKEKEYIESELVNVATYVNSRNEILNNIQGSLCKAYKMPEKEMSMEIRKINLYIKNLQTKNEDVESVLSKIEQINKEFIAKLTDLHPDLTKNDKNIALLLRANLSTKQIATLMDCTPKSVNMARYRMRTHLNLNNDVNLTLYLKSL